MVTMLLGWWYGAGWKQTVEAVGYRVDKLADIFSFAILLKTMFEPWKQMTVYAAPSSALDAKMRVLFDNLFARAFGFVLRSFLLGVGALTILLASLYSLVMIVIWPFIPLLIPAAIVIGVLNV